MQNFSFSSVFQGWTQSNRQRAIEVIPRVKALKLRICAQILTISMGQASREHEE